MAVPSFILADASFALEVDSFMDADVSFINEVGSFIKMIKSYCFWVQ